MKKKISLSLWWGASRWFIHIGVLKYLEEKKIKIIEVSWTSMWAVIASFIALWFTSEEIKEIAKSLDLKKLIDFDLSYWLIKWNKIYKKLEQIFWDKRIEKTNIPLKIVATNIETWEKEVFSKWRIVDAIRASISLPWIFVPYKIWDYHYVDWWVTNNLPIDCLEWENIIWVSALKDISSPLKKNKNFFWFEVKTWFLSYNYQVLHRAILIMLKQNEAKSIKKLKKDWIIIRPKFGDLDYDSFDKIDDFIDLWYKEAKKKLDKNK